MLEPYAQKKTSLYLVLTHSLSPSSSSSSSTAILHKFFKELSIVYRVRWVLPSNGCTRRSHNFSMLTWEFSLRGDEMEIMSFSSELQPRSACSTGERSGERRPALPAGLRGNEP